MYKPLELDAIRQKIDALDNQIHDLLMERADLITSIADEKKKNGIPIVQPAREARMIRRLMERHRGPLPEETIVRIWRELVGSVSLLQTGLSVAVSISPTQPEYWDMAKDYFGSVLPMHRAATPVSALGMLRDNKVNFAVLPWPDLEDESPWWAHLVEGANTDIHIMQRLPYGDKENFSYGNHPALVLAKVGFGTSDDDHSFLAIQLDHNISRARILDKIKAAGLDAIGLYSRRDRAMPSKAWHMVEVSSYVALDDARLKELPAMLGDAEGRCLCLGGYPSPLTYDSKKQKIAESQSA